MTKQPRCPACSRRVRPHHPEIVVTDLESGRSLTYHAAEACATKASAVMLRPGTVHHWAIRTPDGSMN